MSNAPPTQESFLVIGGCGFLGRHIVEQLIARGETKVAVFDLVQRHFDTNVTFFVGDISKIEDVTNAIEKSAATTIIHTASPTHGLSPKIYELVNVTGTTNIITASSLPTSSVRKLVYTSSAGVIYNGRENIVNVDERLEYPTSPLDAYNDTKARAEKLVLEANSPNGSESGKVLFTCALRPAGIFGPGDRQTISGFYAVMKNNQTRFQIGYNDNLFDWTYVVNVAHAHLLAADRLGSTYPLEEFHSPLSPISLSLDSHRIPTSEARPLGPKINPSEADLALARRFESTDIDPSDLRPVLRSKMDQFSSLADEVNDDSSANVQHVGCPIAGQSFFITNCEPVYFWDFARTIWKQLDHTPPYIIVIPAAIGLILATLAEIFSKLTGKEPGFTKYRVTYATQKRYYDTERARRLLDYTPIVGVDEGIKRWTAWYTEELARQAPTNETAKNK